MKRVVFAVAVLAVSLVTFQGLAAARSAPSARTAHVGGMILARNAHANLLGNRIQSNCYFFCRSNNLVYHSGGTVEVSNRKDYAIFWGANFPDSNYKSLITGFFTNVGAAGPGGSNVYQNDTQYYQTISGTTTHIAYSESFAGSWSDTSNPASSGCSSTAGGSVACVSDAQIQGEVNKAISANGWPRGVGNEYFVFLGYGISTCSGSSCAFSQFCAYHGDFNSGGTTIYANMPYTGYNLSACGTGQYPNGSSAADSTINVTSHEENESITDPLLNAWYDSSGEEIGDKCAWNFGSSLGNNGKGNYNQVINGHDYYVQQEWSNASKGCTLT